MNEKSKRVLFWLLVVLIALAVVSCGENEKSKNDEQDSGCDADRFCRNEFEPTLGWILLDDDLAHIDEVLSRAKEFGVTQIQLSHSLVMNVEEITEDEENAAKLRTIAKKAKAKGLEVLFWAHELTGMKLSVCFDESDPFWEERKQQYLRAFELIPELDGVVLMFGSSRPEPWYAMCHCDDEQLNEQVCTDPTGQTDLAEFEFPPHPERVRLIVDTVAAATKQAGKKLFVRTFIHRPEELEWVRQGLNLAKAEADFTVMSKPVPQDFEPYYPNNPIIGTVGILPQVVEFDLAGEYWGQSQILNPQVEYVLYRFRHVWQHHGIGAVCRIERGSHYAMGTPNEINLYATAQFMQNPNVSPLEIYANWFKLQGVELGDIQRLVEIYQLSWQSTIKRHYVLGFWALEKGSELPSEAVAEQLEKRALSLWDEGFDETFEQLKSPTETTLNNIYQESFEAVLAAERALSLFEEIKDRIPTSLGKQLGTRLTHQLLAAKAWMWAKEGIWDYKSKLDGYGEWMAYAAEQLREVANEIEEQVGASAWPANPARLKALAQDIDDKAGTTQANMRPQPFTIGLPKIDPSRHTNTTIEFETSKPATCQLFWGDKIAHTPFEGPKEDSANTQHAFTLSLPKANTLYLVRISCTASAAGATKTQTSTTSGWWYAWTGKEQ